MKKVLSLIILSAVCLCATAQTKPSSNQKFLKRCEKLVDRVQLKYAQNADSVDAWKAERIKIKNLYKERYNAAFNDEEIERYMELSAEYKSKMTEMNLNNLGDKVDSVGAKVSRSMQRTGKKVSGFVKGLKKQSDKNRGRN